MSSVHYKTEKAREHHSRCVFICLKNTNNHVKWNSKWTEYMWYCSHGSAHLELKSHYPSIPMITTMTFEICQRSLRKCATITQESKSLGLRRWSHVTPGEINRLVPFNFNFRAWYILWSPVRCGACALEWEAEWMLIALYLLPCALHPSAIRQTRTGDIRGGLGRG